MSQETQIAADNLEAVHTGHPTPGTYFKVAMILSAITAIEVGIFYLDFLSYGIIPILGLLSTAKFILVAMYYMHLKFDSVIFSTLFVTGLLLAAAVVLALLSLLSFFN